MFLPPTSKVARPVALAPVIVNGVAPDRVRFCVVSFTWLFVVPLPGVVDWVIVRELNAVARSPDAVRVMPVPLVISAKRRSAPIPGRPDGLQLPAVLKVPSLFDAHVLTAARAVPGNIAVAAIVRINTRKSRVMLDDIFWGFMGFVLVDLKTATESLVQIYHRLRVQQGVPVLQTDYSVVKNNCPAEPQIRA